MHAMDEPPAVGQDHGRHPQEPIHRQAGLEALRLLSINHRTAPLEVLERMALPPQRLARLYDELDRAGIEAVALSTCNRTEIYWSSPGAGDDATVEALWMAACEGPAPARERFAALRGRAAAEHLFRVAAGLESLVLGEAEILGQLRDAVERADGRRTSGFFVAGLFRAALRFGGRARQETRIGSGAMSVASASVSLLTRIHPDLSRRTILVIGAGATGLKAARHLRAERAGRIVFLNRTRAHGEAAANELGCESAPLEALPEWLPRADAVVAAAQVSAPILTVPMLRALPAAGGGARVLLDLSLPRAIEPACAQVPGVVHHDLSGLEEIVERNRARRLHEIPRVETLLARELDVFEAQAHESAVRPVLSELRTLAESIRRAEVERAGADGSLDAEVLDRVTRRIVDRLLHGPSMALRRGDLALDGQHAHYLRLMFGLRHSLPGEGAHGPDRAPGTGE